jgi:hypothetical protein
MVPVVSTFPSGSNEVDDSSGMLSHVCQSVGSLVISSAGWIDGSGSIECVVRFELVGSGVVLVVSTQV